MLRDYEYAYRTPELVRPALKYDNRGLVAEGLAFWRMTQKPAEKVAAPAELPSNTVAEPFAEGYAAVLTR